jgi:hypothetical protein
MLRHEGGELVGRAAVGKAAPCLQVRQENELVRVEDLRRLGHEMDAGENDDLGLGGRGLLAEPQAVADEVRDILDVGILVVVRQDHGVHFAPEAIDFTEEVQAGLKTRHHSGGSGRSGRSGRIGLTHVVSSIVQPDGRSTGGLSGRSRPLEANLVKPSSFCKPPIRCVYGVWTFFCQMLTIHGLEIRPLPPSGHG